MDGGVRWVGGWAVAWVRANLPPWYVLRLRKVRPDIVWLGEVTR